MSTRLTVRTDSARIATFRARFGNWAVVTGASDGIGREFAHALAARRLNLVLVARRAAVLSELAAELESAHGIACAVVAADLGKDQGIERLIDITRELNVGLLVCAAGFGTSGEFVCANVEDELDMLAVNCRATVWLCHHFGRRFHLQGRGGLVLMSSLLAFQGVPRAAHYAATKAYVQTLAEGLRIELGSRGVAVIAAAPGPVASGFAARANMRMSLALPASSVANATLDALGRQITIRPGWLSKLLGWSLAPLPRWGRTRILQQVMGGMTAHQADASRATPESGD